MTPLPQLMVAPTGVRRGKADHPALPITIAEIVETAVVCHAAGAAAIHAHVRDADGLHSLDPGLYSELLAQLADSVPAVLVQVTTESGGRFSPADQLATVMALGHGHISVGLREMVPDANAEAHARDFYGFCAEAEIHVQHILYEAGEIARLADLHRRGIVPRIDEVMFPLGRYSVDQTSTPEDLPPFLDAMETSPEVGQVPWMVCAFGARETDCMAQAFGAGGKARVGFENNLYMADGSLARDNAARVAEVAALLENVE
jgi:3-keto-5-aminohexanoate cleavage enzyme